MNNWKEVSLKDYCKTQYGFTASATDVDTEIKFIRITDIVPDFIDWQKVPFCEISESDFDKYKLIEGDIVVARTGATVGYAKQIRSNSFKAVFASYLVKIIPSHEINSRFLGILVESSVYKDFIQIIAGGSAQPNANAKDLTLFKFFLPPQPIQQRIADIISTYTELIEVNNQRIKLLEETARELYKEWFVRMRFPGYKNSTLKKGIPDTWKLKKVNSTFEILGGGTPKTGKQEYWNGNINWFTPTDITGSDGIFLLESSNKITTLGLEKSSAKLFPAYSIMMTSRATIGAVGINTTPGCTNQGFITCLPNETVPYTFLYFWILNNKESFEILGTGSTFLEITKGTFRKMNILLPDEKLIKKFHQQTDPIFKQIEILLKQNTQLKEIRDRLLPRLISGKLQLKTKQQDKQ